MSLIIQSQYQLNSHCSKQEIFNPARNTFSEISCLLRSALRVQPGYQTTKLRNPHLRQMLKVVSRCESETHVLLTQCNDTKTTSFENFSMLPYLKQCVMTMCVSYATVLKYINITERYKSSVEVCNCMQVISISNVKLTNA